MGAGTTLFSLSPLFFPPPFLTVSRSLSLFLAPTNKHTLALSLPLLLSRFVSQSLFLCISLSLSLSLFRSLSLFHTQIHNVSLSITHRCACGLFLSLSLSLSHTLSLSRSLILYLFLTRCTCNRISPATNIDSCICVYAP